MAGGDSLALVEAAIRGGAVTLLAVLAVLLLRDGRRAPAGLYGALYVASIAAYVIASAPGLLHHSWALWLMPARLGAFGAPAMFWLFSRASFDDSFKPSWRDAAPWLLMVGAGISCARQLVPGVCAVDSVLQFAFFGLAIYQAVVGRAADLIEERRKFRVVLIVTAAVYATIIVALEAVMHGPPAGPPLSIVNASGLLAITLAFVVARLTLMPSAEFAPVAVAEPARVDPAPPAEAEAPAVVDL